MRPTLHYIALSVICSTVSLGAPDSVYVVVRNDTVIVWNVRAEENCAARFTIESRLSQDSLYVIQTDTSVLKTTCTCFYDLRATVVGVPAGSYWGVVQRVKLKKYMYPRDTIEFIAFVPFIVSVAGGQQFAYTQFQSSCNPSDVPDSRVQVPGTFSLAQNYPNPFNPTTTITFSLPSTEHVTLAVYDILGRRLSILMDETRVAGLHILRFHGDRLPSSGIYFYRIIAGSFTGTKPMVMIR